jgi:hypothetical protein
MRLIHLPVAAAAFYLGLSISIAPAQQSPDPQGHTTFKSQQGGKEEPGSHASGASTDVFVNGKLAVPGAPAESQTEPAKFSERNAKLDVVPIMAKPLGLTEEQKRRIVASVTQSNAPVAQISAKPADLLPATTQVGKFAADVKAAVPATSDLGFIRTSDKILIVQPTNMIVVDEIAATAQN